MAVLPFPLLRSRVETYRHFTVMAVAVGLHVMIALAALALAFLADVPIVALIFFVAATGLVLIFVSQAWRSPADGRSPPEE